MSFKSTPHRITAQIRDFRPLQGSHPAFIRTIVSHDLDSIRTARFFLNWVSPLIIASCFGLTAALYEKLNAPLLSVNRAAAAEPRFPLIQFAVVSAQF